MSNSTNRFLDDVQRLATVRGVEQRASLQRAVTILGPVAAAHGTLTYGGPPPGSDGETFARRTS